MSPPASAIMSVPSSPEAAGGRDAIDAAVAQELGARFQVERLERRGPRASLYLGRALNGGRPIALKAVWRAGAPPQASEAFATAMAACAPLDHPHIIPLHQYGQTPRLFWYSMQRIEGRSLDETLRDTGPLELTTCLRLVAQLAAALDHAHRHGVTHGNVKPANVMVSLDGVALLGDFAVARALQMGTWPLAPHSRLVGYLAPEESCGGQPGPAADQYALAALTLQCLEAGAPADTSPLVPDTVRHAVARAMSQDPRQRFATLLEFAALLERAAPALAPARASPAAPPLATPPAKPAVLLWDDAYEPDVPDRRFLRRFVIGAALVILLAGAAASGLWLTAPSRKAPAPPLAAAPAPLVREPAPAAPAPAEPAATAQSVPREELPPRPPPTRPPPPRTRPAPVAPAPGRLFVGATPWGDVQIDGRAVGHTPLVALPIVAGWHHVGIVRDGFAPFERRIQLAPGEDVRLTGIVLEPLH